MQHKMLSAKFDIRVQVSSSIRVHVWNRDCDSTFFSYEGMHIKFDNLNPLIAYWKLLCQSMPAALLAVLALPAKACGFYAQILFSAVNPSSIPPERYRPCASQKLHLLPAASGAKNQADGRVFSLLPLVAVQPFQIELHLPLVPGLKFAQLQLHGYKTLEGAVVKKQIQVKILAVNNHALLALDEGEAFAEFKDEAFQLAQNGRFQVVLQIVVFQAEEIKKIGVFEGSRRHGRIRRNLGIGNGSALKGLAGDKLAQVTDAKLPAAACRA